MSIRLASLLPFAISLAACGSPPSSSPADMALLPDPLSFPADKPGPYAVGYHELKTTYDLKSLSPSLGSVPARTIRVVFWYPTLQPKGEHPGYGAIFPSDDNAWIDAPPAPSTFAGGYPILVHSHGYKAWAGSNYKVVDYLVSHGFAVIEPEHLGNTLTDTPDKLPLAFYLQRPLDVRAALDLAAKLPAGDLLSGRFDMNRVAASGHSFGTYTMAALAGTAFDKTAVHAACVQGDATDCSADLEAAFGSDVSDPRVKMIIPLAGGRSAWFGMNPYDPRHIPVLSMYGTLNDGGEGALYDATSGADYTLVTVDGGCHELFNTGNNFVGNMGNNTGIPCSMLPDAEGFALVNTYLVAYLRLQLLGDTSEAIKGIVRGTTSISPRVAVKHKDR